MAEFAEVWKQWKRMCLAVKGNGDRSCENCKLCNLECDAEYPKDQNHYDGKTIEAFIMSWAAEHPEPIYPTWREWLLANRIIFDEDSDYTVGVLMRSKRIPADIAQKLEIEPKEE